MAADEEIVIEVSYDVDEAEKSIDGLSNSIVGLEEKNKSLRADMKKTDTELAKEGKTRSELSTQIAKNSASLKDAKKERNELLKVQKLQANSLDALKQKNKELIQQRNALNTQTEEGRAKFAELNKQINANNETLKRAEEAGGNYGRSVGDYKNKISEALEEHDFFGVSLSNISDTLTSTAGIIGGVIGALTGLYKAYTSSARGANDLSRASDRLDSIMNDLGNSIADVAGDNDILDDALTILQASVMGVGSTIKSEIIVNIKESIRQLGILEAEQEKTKKDQLNRAEVLRQIRDEERNSFDERIAANKELLNVIDQREKDSIAFQEQRLEKVKALLALDKENIELQKEVKDIEFEIADIREEAQGYRSEQLINELALFREANENELAILEEKTRGELMLLEEGSDEKLKLQQQLINSRLALDLEAAGKNTQLQEIAKEKAKNDLQELLLAHDAYNEALLQKKIEAQREQEEKDQALLDEFFEAELEAQIEKEARQVEATVAAATAKADAEIERIQKIEDAEKRAAEAQKAINEARAASFAGTMNQLTQATADYINGEEDAFAQLAKTIASSLIDNIQATLIAKNAEILIQSMSTPDSILSFGATGALRAASIIALTTAAGAAAKTALGSYGDGGQVPLMANGGSIKSGTFNGNSHSNGGIDLFTGSGKHVANVEGRENFYVVNKNASDMINSLSSINQATGGVSLSKSSKFMAKGGQADMSTSNNDNDNNTTAKIVASVMKQMPTQRVLVEDISTGIDDRDAVKDVAVVS